MEYNSKSNSMNAIRSLVLALLFMLAVQFAKQMDSNNHRPHTIQSLLIVFTDARTKEYLTLHKYPSVRYG